jgi:tetratricopeptide (TPR) repeat protein
MIKVYEDMLVNFDPNDNRIRYGLAWAYYMKGYLLAEDSQRQARAYGMPVKKTTAITPLEIASTLLTGQMPTDLSKINIGKTQLPHIPGALEKAQPTVIPQVKTYYEKAIAKLDEILAKNPKDIWAKVYRAHLYAEYTGDLGSSMKVWHQCALEAPNNPAPYFFLGEGYLRLGNLKQSLQYASKAVSLRMTGH